MPASKASKAPPPGYVVSQEGRDTLMRVADHLRLLDRMTHARVIHDLPELQPSCDELLTHYFRIVRDMDAVIRGMRPDCHSS